MPIAVPIVAGTAIRGIAANVMMRGVMERHPNAFLVTLQSFGLTVPLHRAQEQIARDVQRGLADQGRDPDSPLVLVGHSQGALAVLRYTLEHQDQVKHVFSVGCPWHGSVSAGFYSSRITRLTGRNLAPALADMAPNSTFLTELHESLPEIAEKVTNIYSTHEIFIRPYISAHIDIPRVTNALIATNEEYAKHLRTFPNQPVDELIEVTTRVTHASEMNTPEVRSLVWAKVDQLSAQIRKENQARLAELPAPSVPPAPRAKPAMESAPRLTVKPSPS